VPAAVGTPVRNPFGFRNRPGGSSPTVTLNVASGTTAVDWNWWT
jgi:hypothetical protein